MPRSTDLVVFSCFEPVPFGFGETKVHRLAIDPSSVMSLEESDGITTVFLADTKHVVRIPLPLRDVASALGLQVSDDIEAQSILTP